MEVPKGSYGGEVIDVIIPHHKDIPKVVIHSSDGADYAQTTRIQVPKGLHPHEKFHFIANNGRVVDVVVPDGAEEGSWVDVTVPPLTVYERGPRVAKVIQIPYGLSAGEIICC